MAPRQVPWFGDGTVVSSEIQRWHRGEFQAPRWYLWNLEMAPRQVPRFGFGDGTEASSEIWRWHRGKFWDSEVEPRQVLRFGDATSELGAQEPPFKSVYSFSTVEIQFWMSLVKICVIQMFLSDYLIKSRLLLRLLKFIKTDQYLLRLIHIYQYFLSAFWFWTSQKSQHKSRLSCSISR